jgi:hypothetical protein
MQEQYLLKRAVRRWKGQNCRGTYLPPPSEELRRHILICHTVRVILDASARRFQAHKVYLRAAAARRWAIHRQNILRGQRAGPQHASQLKAVDDTFRQVGFLRKDIHSRKHSLTWSIARNFNK